MYAVSTCARVRVRVRDRVRVRVREGCLCMSAKPCVKRHYKVRCAVGCMHSSNVYTAQRHESSIHNMESITRAYLGLLELEEEEADEEEVLLVAFRGHVVRRVIIMAGRGYRNHVLVGNPFVCVREMQSTRTGWLHGAIHIHGHGHGRGRGRGHGHEHIWTPLVNDNSKIFTDTITDTDTRTCRHSLMERKWHLPHPHSQGPQAQSAREKLSTSTTTTPTTRNPKDHLVTIKVVSHRSLIRLK